MSVHLSSTANLSFIEACRGHFERSLSSSSPALPFAGCANATSRRARRKLNSGIRSLRNEQWRRSARSLSGSSLRRGLAAAPIEVAVEVRGEQWRVEVAPLSSSKGVARPWPMWFVRATLVPRSNSSRATSLAVLARRVRQRRRSSLASEERHLFVRQRDVIAAAPDTTTSIRQISGPARTKQTERHLRMI